MLGKEAVSNQVIIEKVSVFDTLLIVLSKY